MRYYSSTSRDWTCAGRSRFGWLCRCSLARLETRHVLAVGERGGEAAGAGKRVVFYVGAGERVVFYVGAGKQCV